MGRGIRALRKDFAGDQRGVAAIEAAFVLPIIAILALVAFDLVRYTVYARKVQFAATTMGELIARNDSGKISQADLESFAYAQFVIFPEALTAAKERGVSVWSTLLATASGVVFKTTAGCSSNCTYTPYVSWTAGVGRPCATALQSASNTSTPTPTTLPAAAIGPNFLIASDVVFNYQPLFTKSLVGTVRIARSYFVAPRYVTSIAFDASAGTESSRACVVP